MSRVITLFKEPAGRVWHGAALIYSLPAFGLGNVRTTQSSECPSCGTDNAVVPAAGPAPEAVRS